METLVPWEALPKEGSLAVSLETLHGYATTNILNNILPYLRRQPPGVSKITSTLLIPKILFSHNTFFINRNTYF